MSTTPDSYSLLVLELEDSMRRLEAAGVLVAVRVNDRSLVRILSTELDAHQAVLDGFVLYSPMDMFYYVELGPSERSMLHDFKQRFGGAVEWRPA